MFDTYSQGAFPHEWHEELIEHARSLRLIPFSSTFHAEAVELSDNVDAPAFNIASFETFGHELIARCASTGKPILISAGVAELVDIEEALEDCYASGKESVALLKYTSAYLAPSVELNLRTIPDMAAGSGCVVGYSDHTRGLVAPLEAVTLGAGIIECHLMLCGDGRGLNGAFGSTAKEFGEMVSAIRQLELSVGAASYELSSSTKRNRRFGRSLSVTRDVEAGEEITRDNVRSVRPADGLHLGYFNDVIERVSSGPVAAGIPLDLELLTER